MMLTVRAPVHGLVDEGHDSRVVHQPCIVACQALLGFEGPDGGQAIQGLAYGRIHG